MGGSAISWAAAGLSRGTSMTWITPCRGSRPTLGPLPWPQRDRVGAAVRVHRRHLVDGGEWVGRVVAQRKDPDPLPTVRVVVSGPCGAARRVDHGPVHRQQQEVGDPIPVPVPHDRVGLEAVTWKVHELLGSGRVGDIEDAEPSYRLVVSVVAGECVVPPEGQVRVDPRVGGRGDQVRPGMPVRVMGGRRRRGKCGKSQGEHSRNEHSPPSPPPAQTRCHFSHVSTSMPTGFSSLARGPWSPPPSPSPQTSGENGESCPLALRLTPCGASKRGTCLNLPILDERRQIRGLGGGAQHVRTGRQRGSVLLY